MEVTKVPEVYTMNPQHGMAKAFGQAYEHLLFYFLSEIFVNESEYSS